MRFPWVVIALWLAMAVCLPAVFPTLKEMAERRPVAILPDDAPAMVASKQMLTAFQQAGTDSFVVVVLSNEDGLNPSDEAMYRNLVEALHRDTGDVAKLQDFLSAPPLREVMTSKDNKAWLLPITLPGTLGTPQSKEAYARVAEVVDREVVNTTLTPHMTGPAATVADLNVVGARDLKVIEFAITVLVLFILLMIYRNPVTMVVPLVSIGVAVVVAQAVVAGAALLGLGIANQTIVFMSGMMVGAGTDYAVFLISRYHDYLRLGDVSDEAVRKALTSIGKVIAASAATVAVTFLGMSFTKLGLFSSVGPALAIAITVAFLGAVTLLPAVLVIVGRRGWIAPRRDLTSRFWRRSGIRIVRRPAIHLVASLVILAILSGFVLVTKYNYDDRKALPANATSSQGYAALEQHFPLNSIIPQYLVISSTKDLREPQALADLEQMAQRVSQLPSMGPVRGITRPTGAPLEQAKVSYQAGEVGKQLGTGSQQIVERTSDLNRLNAGADALADNLSTVRGQVSQAINRAQGLLNTLSAVQNTVGGSKTLEDIDNATKFVASMRELGESVGLNVTNLSRNLDWMLPVLNALNQSPVCNADPGCVTARDQLVRLSVARTDGTFDRLAELGRQLQSTQAAQSLASTTAGLRRAIDTTSSAMRSLGLNTTGLQSRLDSVQDGADKLADAGRQVADGVGQLVDETLKMGGGLAEASAFLMSLKQDAATPAMAGFYVPPSSFGIEDFKKAAKLFISPDGHSVRYLLQTDLNPFSVEAMDQVNDIMDTARDAQPNTELADASVSVVGFPVVLRDTRDYYNHDIRFIVVVTILVVLLILVTLLRAIIAPIYLIMSVVISYLAALGIGALFFQFLLGQELHWSVPGLTFIILVAVGADYNMLLISRIREESGPGIRLGVIRTVGATGGVITAAGLIFAATMFGLVFSSISTMVQSGFVVGVGLLIDTFLVRTITVPAAATLVGDANWWPSRQEVATSGHDSVAKT
ncbi:MMPL/RND family transporter [[Mycobacterium] appelbergii]|uniref:MMPL/RND family transporter n=1 Tax=[Mycobacterium] appelbergii TaxID=2939269 RepID=UPI002939204B|nr:RND family transporter [Mycobacterium sp. 21AC1]